MPHHEENNFSAPPEVSRSEWGEKNQNHEKPVLKNVSSKSPGDIQVEAKCDVRSD